MAWTEITGGRVNTSFSYKMEQSACEYTLSMQDMKDLFTSNTKFEYMAYSSSSNQELAAKVKIVNTRDPNVLPKQMEFLTNAPRINGQYTIFSG